MENFKKFLVYFLLIILGLAFARHFIEAPIIAIAFIGMVAFVAYKLDLPKFGLWLFFISFILRIIVVILFETPIVSDYAVMYDTAKEIISGNLNAAKTAEFGYMLRWGYQMGYTLFMVLILFISNSALAIKIVNCFATSLIVLLIYLIAKEITNKKVARVASVLYMFFPFPLLLNTVLSNQHIASMFFLLAIYILISKKTENMNNILKFFLIGLCLAIGNIIRPEAIIFITSILLFLILTKKKGTTKLVIKKFLILFVTYFIITTSASIIVSKTNISPSGFENKEPLWKIAVGFSQKTKGDYDGELASHFIGASRDKQLKIIYNSTVKSFDKLPSLFLYKEQHFWLDGDLSSSLGYLEGKFINIFGKSFNFDTIRILLDSINQLYIYVFFALAWLSIYINRKNMSNTQTIFLIIMLVCSGVYLLIECTPKYAYTAQMFLVLMSTYSLDYIFKYIQKSIVRKKGKNTIKSK